MHPPRQTHRPPASTHVPPHWYQRCCSLLKPAMAQSGSSRGFSFWVSVTKRNRQNRNILQGWGQGGEIKGRAAHSKRGVFSLGKRSRGCFVLFFLKERGRTDRSHKHIAERRTQEPNTQLWDIYYRHRETQKRRGGEELCPTFSVFNFLIRLWLSSSSSSFFTKIEFPINPESGVLLLTSPTAEEVQWKGLLLPPAPPLAPKP